MRHTLLEDFNFVSGSSQLWAQIVRSSGSDSRPVVILATGAGRAGSQGETWSHIGDELSRAGLSHLKFDFQGLGKSEGDIRNLTVGIAIQNLRDAIRVVKESEMFDNSRIGILGSSFGGLVAIHVVASDPAIRCLALRAPATFYPEVLENIVGDTPDRPNRDRMSSWKDRDETEGLPFGYSLYEDGLRYNAYHAARHIRCPTLVVHGLLDEVVPVRQSERLCRALDSSQLVKVSTMSHELSPELHMQTSRLIAQWLQQILGGQSAG